MENGPFIDDFPINTSIYKGFSMAMLNNQTVIYLRFAASSPATFAMPDFLGDGKKLLEIPVASIVVLMSQSNTLFQRDFSSILLDCQRLPNLVN